MISSLKKNHTVVRLYLWLKRKADYSSYLRGYFQFKKRLSPERGFAMTWADHSPSLGDKTSTTAFDAHYIYHPAWAARILAMTKPAMHVDISSTLNFCAIVSAFQPMKFYDYRPAQLNLSNLKSAHADLCNLDFKDSSLSSLSCMHTLEHVGLGRYGDPIDPDGDVRAAHELVRVVEKGGDLLIVVPIGRARIVFNSHRVYSYDQIVSLFSGLEVRQFSLIPDNALDVGMIANATKTEADRQNYGCGCFWFVKK